MKSDVSGWDSSAVTIEIGIGHSLCGCDSKTAGNGTLFLCPKLIEVCESSGELAVVVDVEGRKTTLLGVRRLVCTRAASFVCSKALGERIGEGFCEKMEEVSNFSRFWVKPAIS